MKRASEPAFTNIDWFRAVADNDLLAVKHAIDINFDVNCRVQSGKGALVIAALSGHFCMVKLLLACKTLVISDFDANEILRCTSSIYIGHLEKACQAIAIRDRYAIVTLVFSMIVERQRHAIAYNI